MCMAYIHNCIQNSELSMILARATFYIEFNKRMKKDILLLWHLCYQRLRIALIGKKIEIFTHENFT